MDAQKVKTQNVIVIYRKTKCTKDSLRLLQQKLLIIQS